jgi:hypothetical protein
MQVAPSPRFYLFITKREMKKRQKGTETKVIRPPDVIRKGDYRKEFENRMYHSRKKGKKGESLVEHEFPS